MNPVTIAVVCREARDFDLFICRLQMDGLAYQWTRGKLFRMGGLDFLRVSHLQQAMGQRFDAAVVLEMLDRSTMDAVALAIKAEY